MLDRATVCAVLPLSCSLAYAGPQAVPVEGIGGERLPPEAFGPAIVETWDEMVERADAHPQPPRIDVPAPFNRAGAWSVPSDNSTYFPHSGEHYITNKYGDTALGIGFPSLTHVHEAWIAGQGGDGAWAEAVRVIGYRDGREVGRTGWFEDVDDTPSRFEIDLPGVDRIVVESSPSTNWGGWFALDDLAFTANGARERTVLDFEDTGYRFLLTNSNYAGLTWEAGDGLLAEGDGIHSPVKPEVDRDDPPGFGANGDEEDVVPLDPAQGDPVAPTLALEFEAVRRGDAGQFSFPPDTCGAVGLDHFVTVVNLNFAVHNKDTGSQINNIALTSFQPGTGGDPRVIYDHFEDRWIVVSTNFNNRIYFAYSNSDNPLLSWFKTSIVISSGSDSGKWPDYPTLGVDENGIYVASFMVGSPSTMTILAIDKAPLLDGSPNLGTVTAFRGLSAVGAIQPCVTYGDSGGVYTISRWSTSSLRVRQIVGDLGGTPTLQSTGFVAIPSHSAPPDAEAQGSSVNVDTVGTRLMNAVYRDGHIYAAHTIGIGSRAAVRWYKIDADTLQDEAGTVLSFVRSFYFPGICVNTLGDITLGFSGSNADEFIGAWYTGKRGIDVGVGMADPVRYRDGSGSINLIDGFGRNRWGDYSLTTVDPEDDVTFYTIQAYAHSTNTWSTRVARLEVENPNAPVNDDCADAVAIGDGTFPFSTQFAVTDGPDDVACFAGGESQIDKDLWYVYTAPCDGVVTASLCASDFDNRIAVYTGTECPDQGGATLLTCVDDFCGDQAQAIFAATSGQQFILRVGGTAGASGTGDLVVSCAGSNPCPADLDGDDEVAFGDLLILLAAWGPCDACEADLDDDGQVAFGDLLVLLAAWGPCA